MHYPDIDPIIFALGPLAIRWYGLSYLLYGISSPYYWYAVYVARVRDRGREIWTAAGRDPSRVKGTVNIQMAPGGDGNVGPLLTFLAARSAAEAVGVTVGS